MLKIPLDLLWPIRFKIQKDFLVSSILAPANAIESFFFHK